MKNAGINELLGLSVDEKLDLIDSIGQDFPLTPAQSHELARRIALIKADHKAGKTWGEIRDS